MSVRDKFLSSLRAGLRGMPASAVNEIIADYDTHFREAVAAGRTEQQAADRLGDPSRLARELRAEAGVRRFEENHNIFAALGAIVAVLGLATIDLLFLLPILLALGAIVLAFIVVGLCVCFAGGLFLIAALFHALPGFTGGWLQGVLVGIGATSGGAAVVACCILFITGTANLLVRYGRLHYRALTPLAEQPID